MHLEPSIVAVTHSDMQMAVTPSLNIIWGFVKTADSWAPRRTSSNPRRQRAALCCNALQVIPVQAKSEYHAKVFPKTAKK